MDAQAKLVLDLGVGRLGCGVGLPYQWRMMTCELNIARGEEADNVYRVKEEPCMCEHCMSGETCIKAKGKEKDLECEARNETVEERHTRNYAQGLPAQVTE